MVTASSKLLTVAWQLRSLLLLLVVFCGSGASCNQTLNPFASVGPPAPEVLLAGSSIDQVILAINQNASRIASYQTNNARISLPGVPTLNGNIASLQPGKMRFQASTMLTGAELDLGSNEQLFWFWVKRNNPPDVYFCRHDQYAGSTAQKMMPIEPQWLLDALGMMQLSPSDRHEGPFPHSEGQLEIRSVIQTRSGQMSKSTIIDARRAWVLEQHIYDATGTLVASSRSQGHRYYPAVGVSLPQKIKLEVPAAQLSLSIDVGTVQLNALADNPALWNMPTMSGSRQVDLGTAAPGSIAPIQSARSSDWNTGASPAFIGLTPQTTTNTPRPTTTMPLSQLPAPVAIRPVSAAVQLTQQPVTMRIRPGGVAIPLGQR